MKFRFSYDITSAGGQYESALKLNCEQCVGCARSTVLHSPYSRS